MYERTTPLLLLLHYIAGPQGYFALDALRRSSVRPSVRPPLAECTAAHFHYCTCYAVFVVLLPLHPLLFSVLIFRCLLKFLG